jgi:hypothetical protein
MQALPVVCPCAWYREWRIGLEKLQERQNIIYSRIQNDIVLGIARTFVDVICWKKNLLLWIPNCTRKMQAFN